MNSLTPMPRPPFHPEGDSAQWYRRLPDAPGPEEPVWCPRCGQAYRAGFYIGHAWNERP